MEVVAGGWKGGGEKTIISPNRSSSFLESRYILKGGSSMSRVLKNTGRARGEVGEGSER